MRVHTRFRDGLFLMALTSAAAPARGANLIHRSVVGSGGTGATASVHAVHSTLGQPIAGQVSAAAHAIWSGFWTPEQSTVGLLLADTIPQSFQLYPGVPNPFTDRTTIHYDVPVQGGEVALRIYDITGRLVRSLVDSAQTPGRHAVLWDGRNELGGRAAPGIYLVWFRAPGTSKSHKLVQMGGNR